MKQLLKVCVYITVIFYLLVYLLFGSASGNSSENVAWKMECDQSTCSIQLSNTIFMARDYFELRKALEQVHPDNVVFHLSGFGGYVDGAVYLANIVESIQGNTIMQVDGDVYSAHAVLAFTGKQTNLPANALFYFHLSSGTNMAPIDCLSSLFSMDRGHWGYTSCIDQSNQINNAQNSTMIKYATRILNENEIIRLIDGNTIVLTVDEIKNRLSREGDLGTSKIDEKPDLIDSLTDLGNDLDQLQKDINNGQSRN